MCHSNKYINIIRKSPTRKKTNYFQILNHHLNKRHKNPRFNNAKDFTY